MGYPWKQLGQFGKNWLNDNGYFTGSNPAPEGDLFFVDGTSGVDGEARDGKSWATAWKTIVYAVSRAAAYDTIYVGPGTFDEGEAIVIDLDGLTITGADTSNNHYKTLLYSTGAYPMIQVSANDCEIAYLGFAHAAADTTIELGKANSDSPYKLHVHHCKFDGWGTSTGAIKQFHSTCDAPDIHIEHCLFRSYADDVIYSDFTRGRINNNIIHVDTAGKTGIYHFPNAGSRPDTVIHSNRIIGLNSSDIGIELVSSPTAGALIVYDNWIMNCATSITQNANSAAFCRNYIGGDGGGTIIDPIA